MILKYKNIIIIGAAQGVGRGLAEAVLEQGGSVTLVDRDGEELKAFAATQDAARVLPLVGAWRTPNLPSR
jgi:NAD(P)-dependent dehydrogenase (short-subunit alcohol dehydrogenase family)